MKRALLIFALCTGALAAPFTNQTQIALEWDLVAEQMTNGTVYLLFGTTNLSTPTTNWPSVGTVSGTNRLYFTVTPGAYFYTARASNFWGVSDFSSAAWTPAPPRDDVTLRVRKGP